MEKKNREMKYYFHCAERHGKLLAEEKKKKKSSQAEAKLHIFCNVIPTLACLIVSSLRMFQLFIPWLRRLDFLNKFSLHTLF